MKNYSKINTTNCHWKYPCCQSAKTLLERKFSVTHSSFLVFFRDVFFQLTGICVKEFAGISIKGHAAGTGFSQVQRLFAFIKFFALRHKKSFQHKAESFINY
jgi:hypothetical protein